MRGPDCRRDERGAVAVLVAIVLLVLGGFMALSLNVGHSRAVRGELQNAVDAAALAGAREIDGTLGPIVDRLPHSQAVDFAGRHVTDKDTTVDISPQNDVILGHWNPFASNPDTAFEPVTVNNAADARRVNAVRVLAGREASRGNALEVYFGAAFLGNPERTNVRAEAIAVNGGPCADACPDVPLVFFDCGIINAETYDLDCQARPHMTAQLSPDPTDTVGLTSLSEDSSASTTTYREIISQTNCEKYHTTVGEMVNVSNGNQGLTTLCGVEKNQPTFDRYCHMDPATGICLDPVTIRAPIVAGECPPRFNQVHEVIGFASFRILKMECRGNEAFMEFEFLCNQTQPDAGRIGCGWFGTGPLQPKLVR